MTLNSAKEKSQNKSSSTKTNKFSAKRGATTPLEGFVPLLPPDENEQKPTKQRKGKGNKRALTVEQSSVESKEHTKRKRASDAEKKSEVEKPRTKTKTGKKRKGTQKQAPKTEQKQETEQETEEKAKREKNSNDVEGRGVIYLGHLPYGFFEEGIHAFFSQFGDITRFKLSRNKQGKSKHYAFIEFKEKEVAQIVAEAMDNYLLYGRRLKCEMVNPERLHNNAFVSKKYFKLPWKQIATKQHNKERTAAEQEKRTKKLLAKEADRRKILAELGIEYHFSGYQAQALAKPKVHKLD